MKAAHTPGPWPVSFENSDQASGGQWFSAGPAQIWFPYTRDESIEAQALANAKLVAAAPDMLAALQHIESVYRLNVVKDGEPSSTLANLQAVIAKALGETT